MTPIPQRALNRARDVRPLDRFRSIKIKLGVLVAVSVTFSGSFTAIGVSAGIKARYVVSVAVILSLIGTQILAHGMTSPLRSMADAVSRIARGDYSRRVKAATSRDEVGRLAAAFNLMAADLEAVDRQRKELIANVSHELRTPISALRAVLENVVDGVTEPDPPTMRLALEQAERLGRLVDTLLDLSRIDAGAVELDREDVDLPEFLGTVAREATVKLLARGATGERPRTVVDVQPPDLTVFADRERLHQVAANLLDNAIRHSPPGGVVTLRARPLPGAGAAPETAARPAFWAPGTAAGGANAGSAAAGTDTAAGTASGTPAAHVAPHRPTGVRIEVCDQGPGIPPGERVRVFDRFDRGSRQAADGGTGLGLAIARWVVDLHGGRISVAEPDEADEAPGPGGPPEPGRTAGLFRRPVPPGGADPTAAPAAPPSEPPAPGCVIRVDLP